MTNRNLFLCLILGLATFIVKAENLSIKSPDGNLKFDIRIEDNLSYTLSKGGEILIYPSLMGFEFYNEKPIGITLELINDPIITLKQESYNPVVKNRHSHVDLEWNEMSISLKEKDGERRRIDLTVKLFNEGLAFKYHLYDSSIIGNRYITKELTEFNLSASGKAWAADFGGYTSSQESEYNPILLKEIPSEATYGLPLLVELSPSSYIAITEADINDYPGFYIGRIPSDNKEIVTLYTKLSPLPGQKETGLKVRFDDETESPWRVVLVAENPGRFIEYEIIEGLNPPTQIKDTSWIQPGISAWDHWWSGEVKMEMDVIKEYIDFASEQHWPYMLIDWQWYGPFNTPEADITKEAPQLNMKEILDYAASKNVKCWLWLYSSDVNRNDNYKEAFKLYKDWGIVGIKIDFMDRDDQEMVNWYRRILEEAAQNELMVDFHGAYKPDGITRTYPNLLTREGVLGEEYSKFSDRIIPSHNVTLPFTRMIAGAMDYTPGGFLNVTKENFKQQTPTLVMNTRSAELAKFIIYESPLTVFSDHPRNVLGQSGSEFLKGLPTVWDDTKYIDGYPGEFIVIARKNGDNWYLGAMNNENSRNIEVDTSFLPVGNYEITYWEDGPKASKNPTDIIKKTKKFRGGEKLKIKMAEGGGFASIISLAK